MAPVSLGKLQKCVDTLKKVVRPQQLPGSTETAEAYLNACASKADAVPSTVALNGFKAKLYASEMAVEVTNKAVQVLGGHGYCRDYAVERLFRDARGLTLHFKTSEWLRQDVAKAALKI